MIIIWQMRRIYRKVFLSFFDKPKSWKEIVSELSQNNLPCEINRPKYFSLNIQEKTKSWSKLRISVELWKISSCRIKSKFENHCHLRKETYRIPLQAWNVNSLSASKRNSHFLFNLSIEKQVFWALKMRYWVMIIDCLIYFWSHNLTKPTKSSVFITRKEVLAKCTISRIKILRNPSNYNLPSFPGLFFCFSTEK